MRKKHEVETNTAILQRRLTIEGRLEYCDLYEQYCKRSEDVKPTTWRNSLKGVCNKILAVQMFSIPYLN